MFFQRTGEQHAFIVLSLLTMRCTVCMRNNFRTKPISIITKLRIREPLFHISSFSLYVRTDGTNERQFEFKKRRSYKQRRSEKLGISVNFFNETRSDEISIKILFFIKSRVIKQKDLKDPFFSSLYFSIIIFENSWRITRFAAFVGRSVDKAGET